jgi:hypothetical protein
MRFKNKVTVVTGASSEVAEKIRVIGRKALVVKWDYKS